MRILNDFDIIIFLICFKKYLFNYSKYIAEVQPVGFEIAK